MTKPIQCTVKILDDDDGKRFKKMVQKLRLPLTFKFKASNTHYAAYLFAQSVSDCMQDETIYEYNIEVNGEYFKVSSSPFATEVLEYPDM